MSNTQAAAAAAAAAANGSPPPKPPKPAALQEFVSELKNQKRACHSARASVRRLERQGRVAERLSQFGQTGPRQLGGGWRSEENLSSLKHRQLPAAALRRNAFKNSPKASATDALDARIDEEEEEEDEDDKDDDHQAPTARSTLTLAPTRVTGGHVRSVVEVFESKSTTSSSSRADAPPPTAFRSRNHSSEDSAGRSLSPDLQQQQEERLQRRHTAFLEDIYADIEIVNGQQQQQQQQEQIYDVAGYSIRQTTSIENLADCSEYASISVQPNRSASDASFVEQQEQMRQSAIAKERLVQTRVSEAFAIFYKLAAITQVDHHQQQRQQQSRHHQPTVSSTSSAGVGIESDSDDDDGSRSNLSEEVADRIRRAEEQKQLSEPVLNQGLLAKRTKHDQLFTGCSIISFDQQQQQQLQTNFSHPQSFEESNFCQQLPQFCFPDASSIMEHCSNPNKLDDYLKDCDAFSFVMTEQTGVRHYGYCLRYKVEPHDGPYHFEAACIVSSVDSEQLFRGVLEEARSKRLKVGRREAAEFLVSVYNRPLPMAGSSFEVTTTDTNSSRVVRLTFTRPACGRLQHVRYRELLTFPGVRNTLLLFAAALHERKLVLVSDNPRLLSQCTQALASLLYPMQWQHAFVPILPTVMLRIVCSPTPFIVGVLRRDVEAVLNEDLEDDVMVADLDSGKFLRRKGDEKKLLSKKLQRSLLRCLDANRQLESQHPGISDLLIVSTFLRFFAVTIGHCQAHVSASRFNKEAFCSAPKSKGLRSLLKVVSETGNFHIFISDLMDGTAFEANKLTVSSVISDFNKAVKEFCDEGEVSKGFFESFRSKMRKLFTVTKPDPHLQLQHPRINTQTLSSSYSTKPTNSLRSNSSVYTQQQQL